MSTVRELRPGDHVRIQEYPESATFITSTPHPYYLGLTLVIWKMENSDRWSFDALHHDQYIGDVQFSTPEQRLNRLNLVLGANQRPWPWERGI